MSGVLMEEHERSCHAGYAFLNHSSETLPNHLPPSLDGRLHQKRKRTSPEDQAVLEAAYDRDPKPDKTARLEVVKQVALGEKEVQIWFQNRRQTSRRKSRPLLPHEIYQLSRSGYGPHTDPSQPSSGSRFDQREHPKPSTANTTVVVDGDRLEHSHSDSSTQGNNLASYEIPAAFDVRPQQCAPPMSSSQRESVPTVSTNDSISHSDSVPESMHMKPQHRTLQDQSSVPSLRKVVSSNSAARRRSEDAVVRVGAVKKSSSLIRLSLSHDGKAEIVTKDCSFPSPPRPPQVLHATATIKGSQPQLANGSIHAHPMPDLKPMQRSLSGRSRDSRAWEFWCDKDARSELEEKAEKDASGSAADAIDLLRSTSGRKVLGTLSAKRNPVPSRHFASTKRTKLDGKPSLLQRSNTTLGRLQSRPIHSTAPNVQPLSKLKDSEFAASVYIHGNDSDKENWSPPSSEHSIGFSRDEESLDGGEANREAGSNIAIASTRKRSRSLSNEIDNDPERDSELAAFMRGGNKSNSISEEEELDCVQGLLSLSQGNWR